MLKNNVKKYLDGKKCAWKNKKVKKAARILFELESEDLSGGESVDRFVLLQKRLFVCDSCAIVLLLVDYKVIALEIR